jgi:ERCC4-type nuclease
MIIQIDNREKELIIQIDIIKSIIPAFANIKVEIVLLPIGDILIVDAENKETKLIFERKSICDLSASIKDGRYEEQSYRLDGLSHHNHNIIYLIEGDVNKTARGMNTTQAKQTVYSAIFSLNYYKGFSVIRTFNMEETAIFICNTASKLIKERNGKKAYYSTTNTNTNTNATVESPSLVEERTDKDYVNVVKKFKKDNITRDNISEIMLCQIPGISSVTALAIIEKHKSLSNLLTELSKDGNCLKDISYTNTKGQSRKINQKSAEIIKQFLL